MKKEQELLKRADLLLSFSYIFKGLVTWESNDLTVRITHKLKENQVIYKNSAHPIAILIKEVGIENMRVFIDHEEIVD